MMIKGEFCIQYDISKLVILLLFRKTTAGRFNRSSIGH